VTGILAHARAHDADRRSVIACQGAFVIEIHRRRVTTMNDQAARIAELNDAHRRSMSKVTLSSGLASQPDSTIAALLKRIAEYDAWNEGDDPYGERDFGVIVHDCERVYWKIDYFDLAMEGLSEDPADPAVTRRVLTVCFADEY